MSEPVVHFVELKKLTLGGTVGRYGWDRLRNAGETMVLTGSALAPDSARQMAYKYAARRGWRVTVHVVYQPEKKVIVTRLH